ncbi:MAG: NAD-dependent alcohol dehydrogenase, partial [Chloroflexi bacterium]|nr:NAD-dependent alcohol dehydrogenase [Chloroflexota bacterium]
LTQDLGIPQRLREIGVPRELLDAVAKSCIETQQRVLLNNARSVTLEQARAILEEAW